MNTEKGRRKEIDEIKTIIWKNIEIYAEALNRLLTTDKQFYSMKESDLCLYRQARLWSGTTIVSLPAESVRQLNIEEGETLRVEIKKTRESDPEARA